MTTPSQTPSASDQTRLFILAAAGLGLLVAGFFLGAYFGTGIFGGGEMTASAPSTPDTATAGGLGAQPPASTRAVAVADANTFCPLGLGNAKDFGLLPNNTELAGSTAAGTAVTGRYVCKAKNDVGNYEIVFDTLCDDATNSRCLTLYSVGQEGGATLYRRHE